MNRVWLQPNGSLRYTRQMILFKRPENRLFQSEVGSDCKFCKENGLSRLFLFTYGEACKLYLEKGMPHVGGVTHNTKPTQYTDVFLFVRHNLMEIERCK